MQRLFPCLIYKADNAFYQGGTYASISCNQVKIGDFGMNTYGEIVPLPYNTSPLIDTVLVPEGTVFPSPTAFGDTNFKKVTQVKDMDSLVTYYCDTDSYNTNFVQCNPVSAGAACSIIPSSGTGTVFAEQQSATSFKFSWDPLPGTIGVEYAMNIDTVNPDSGTELLGTPTVTLSGLDAATTYYFHIRNICGSGLVSGWNTFNVTTS